MMADRPIPRRAGLAIALVGCLVALPAAAEGQTSSAAERRAVDRAERLRGMGSADEARVALEEFLAEAPASPGALALLHEILVEAGDPGGALPFIEEALRAEPVGPAVLRELWVDALIAARLADSARVVADAWATSAPDDGRAWLSLAARAIERLEAAADRGLSDLGIDRLRADLLLALGDIDSAAEVWVSLLARETPAIDEVEADLRRAPHPASALAPLAGRLRAPGSPVAAGALLALRVGDAEVARRLAVRIDGDDRADFLRDYVREAEMAGVSGEVAWAATELVLLSPRPVDKLRWRAMAADRALVAGDTAEARASFAALASETRVGDGPHDAASRRLFELLAADPERLEEARSAFERYRREYPDSARAHGKMAGGLAEGWARRGDLAGAESVIRGERDRLDAGAHPPLDAAAARIAFWGGERDSAIARTGRSLAEEGLSAAERTTRLRLLTMLSAGDSLEVRHAGRVAFGLHGSPATYDPTDPLEDLEGAPRGPGRPTVLAYLGDLAADADRVDLAGALRLRVAEEYPQSAEAPAAILALARSADPPDAREWLERLIVGYPESALAPVARRLLSELEEGRGG